MWSEDSVETDVALAVIWQGNTSQAEHSIICQLRKRQTEEKKGGRGDSGSGFA